jgi:hypothetical protein
MGFFFKYILKIEVASEKMKIKFEGYSKKRATLPFLWKIDNWLFKYIIFRYFIRLLT